MKKLFCILIAIICCIPCVQLTFVSAGFEESVEQPILLENLEFCIKGLYISHSIYFYIFYLSDAKG